MAQKSYFFDSVDHDRIYTTADFARVFGAIAGRDGVIYGYGDELNVTPGTGMNVLVDTGAAFVQGRMLEVYDEAEVLAVTTADATNPRIDRVIVRLDLSVAERRAYLAVKPGTPAANPAAPLLQQDATIWELSLAQVRIAAGATGITADDIIDEREWVLDARPGLAGSATFAGPAGRTITHDLGHTDYDVTVTPTDDPLGFLGEVWVIKSANAVVVYNSGSATTSFEWRIVEVRA